MVFRIVFFMVDVRIFGGGFSVGPAGADSGGGMLPAASFAALYASLLPATPTWDGIHRN
jgi:hypothetical protein